MAVSQMVSPNLSEDPLRQILHQELAQLLVDLGTDPKYKERVVFIKALLADPQFLKVEQIYFVPELKPWPVGD